MEKPASNNRSPEDPLLFWAVGIVGVVATAFVCFVADAVVRFIHEPPCGFSALDPDEVSAGQRELFLMVGVVAGVWMLGWLLAGRRRNVLILALAAVAPALLIACSGLSTGHWDDPTLCM